MHGGGVPQSFKERRDPQPCDARQTRGIALAAGENGAHLFAIFGAKRGRVKQQQHLVITRHVAILHVARHVARHVVTRHVVTH